MLNLIRTSTVLPTKVQATTAVGYVLFETKSYCDGKVQRTSAGASVIFKQRRKVDHGSIRA